MSHQTAKMLVEAGIIPKNAIQQLAHYRLVPEGYAELHGTQPLDAGDSDKVTTFVKALGEAITNDMAELRETEFDHPGSYRHLQLEFENCAYNGFDDVLVDRLGRLIVPNEMPWSDLKAVRYADERFSRPVVKKEPRYEGAKSAALVVYVESAEAIKADANAMRDD